MVRQKLHYNWLNARKKYQAQKRQSFMSMLLECILQIVSLLEELKNLKIFHAYLDLKVLAQLKSWGQKQKN